MSLVGEVEGRVPLYTEEFAADPHTVYRAMRRRWGALAPVWLAPEVQATLVLDLYRAREILNDEVQFPADPRLWQRHVPPGCPLLPMMEWRPNALRSVGATRQRYRRATNDALDGVDINTISRMVERLADPLIDAVASTGTADVLTDYALPLTFAVLNTLLGCPAETGHQVARASALMFESTDTAAVNQMLDDALIGVVRLKRARPADDIATRLVEHDTRLDDIELINALVTCYAAGIEPLTNLVTNTLAMMLTHDSRSGAAGFALTTRDAVRHTLSTDPPLANFCITYPVAPKWIAGYEVPAHEPLVVSMAACSTDPALSTGTWVTGDWGLGFGTGIHRCPDTAQKIAVMVATDAIDYLLDKLPEITIPDPAALQWRLGPFHRALQGLPVTFPPVRHR
ncbi:cytochrome P450 [Nocardia puris]|uniref:cytochrome P450 n=1 Tax=Nocardia puris TaxID=208602 RepID=UPI0018963302|nr:cytochrome P450 [Nocardia puris]